MKVRSVNLTQKKPKPNLHGPFSTSPTKESDGDHTKSVKNKQKNATLDDSASFTPNLHIWTRSKQPWIRLPEGVQALEKQPGTAEEWMQLLQD